MVLQTNYMERMINDKVHCSKVHHCAEKSIGTEKEIRLWWVSLYFVDGTTWPKI